ncbi:hypothetical protein [Streptomyces sp. SM8]|jgi:hypothetical protein|uniref:hypothetical protein n=1 Tax=Streptomyces sp. SM8 TaxID=1195457 RepID=UPI0002830E9C|nr:hypothetical protein [Streptomyces sp. SM8]PKA37896.1 hypothetical protein SM8_029160 [Streptomyces sp. SM8]
MLFTRAELEALLGRPLTDAQYDLAADTAEDIVRGEVGARLTDPPQPGVKAVAVALAARVLTNPGGVRSEQAGGLLISYADSQTGAGLSSDERRRLRRAVGMASGASSLDIAPADTGGRSTVWRAL